MLALAGENIVFPVPVQIDHLDVADPWFPFKGNADRRAAEKGGILK